MKPGAVQRIFNDHFPALEASRQLDSRRLKAAWGIMTCRTPLQGYHIDECPNGDYAVRVANSCKHRACPQCGAVDTELWLERQLEKEIACPHTQITFTSPADLDNLWRWNRKLFTTLYCQAAWHTLKELLADVRYLGALPGAIIVFQSWGDELQEHLHLHVILTSGGLTPDGRWVASREKYLLPGAVLMAKFRGKFIAYLRKAFDERTVTGKTKKPESILVPPPDMRRQQCLNLLNKLGRKKWHVQVETAYAEARGALKYTGRYIRRGPLSEKRIISYNGQLVHIAYAHPEKHTTPSFKLTADDFVLRVLAHAPAKGSHCVRVYGLYHSACREKLNQARCLRGQPRYKPEEEPPDVHELLHRMFPDFTGDLCPVCHTRLVTTRVAHRAHSPPQKIAA